MFFPHLERRIHTYILSISHTLCSLQARITNRTRLYSKVVYCRLNEMHELRIERSINTHRLLRVSVKSGPDEMHHTIRKLYSMDRKGPWRSVRIGRNWNPILRTARALNDPYGSNKLNLPLADRYSVGVLDMTRKKNSRRGKHCSIFALEG